MATSATDNPRRLAQSGVPQREQTSLDVVLRSFAAATDADTGMLVGFGPSRRPRLLAACGEAERTATVPWVNGTFLGRTLRAPGPQLERAATEQVAADSPAWSAVAAPVLGPEDALGGIYAGFDPASRLPGAELLWTATAHAALAGLCITDSGGIAAALRSSGLDQLTGCLTFQGIVEMVKREVERSRRQGHSLACCFLDLDGFKSVNDAHGHLNGNRVLAATGEALRGAARPYDGIGRFGGDEFVIVLPDTNARTAHGVAERMRQRVTLGVERAMDLRIEPSVGLAELRTGETALDLLEAADRALQIAKATGGGRVAGDEALTRRQFDGLAGLTRTIVRGLGRTSPAEETR